MSDNIVVVVETIQKVEVFTGETVATQFATLSEVNAGTDVVKAIKPHILFDSVYAMRAVEFWVINADTNCATGDGKGYFRVPSVLNGFSLSAPSATCITAGVTGTMTVQIRNVTKVVDVLSTRITIDSAETDSITALVPAVVNASNKVVNTGDLLAIDIDTIHSGTAAKGLIVSMSFTP